MHRYVFRRPFDYRSRLRLVVSLYPVVVVGGNSPTGALYGPLVGSLGGPI